MSPIAALEAARPDDLLWQVDAATHFSEALLARRPPTSNKLLAVYGALMAHGTDIDAKGVSSMIPGIDAAHIATAMRGCGAERQVAPAQRMRFGIPECRADRGLVGDGTRARPT